MAEIVMTSGFVFNGYIHQVCDNGGIANGDDLGVALIKNEYSNQVHPIAQETYENITQYIKSGATTVIGGVGVERVSDTATSSYFVKITAPENSQGTTPNNVFPIPNASGTGSLVIYTNPNSSSHADKVLVCWFGLSEEVTASTFDLSFDNGVILKYSPAQTYLYDIVTSAGDGKVKVDDTDAYPGFLFNKIVQGDGVNITTASVNDEKILRIGATESSLWKYDGDDLTPKDINKSLKVYSNENLIQPLDGDSGYALTIVSDVGLPSDGYALDVHGNQTIHNDVNNRHSLYISHDNTNAQAVYINQSNISHSYPAFQVDNKGIFNTVRLNSQNSSNIQPVFHIQSSGTGPAINVQGNGPAVDAIVSTSGSIMTLRNISDGAGVNIETSGVSATLNIENLGSGSVLYAKGNTTSPAIYIENTSGSAGIIAGNTTTGPSVSFTNAGGGTAAIFNTSGSTDPTVYINNSGNAPGLTVSGGIQIDRGTTEPTGKFDGMPFYNTTDKKYKYFDGTEWNDIGGGGDGKVLATSSDTTPGYLIEKISAGSNVEIINNGSYIEISAAAGGGSGDLPITTRGDIVVGDENGEAIRMPIGTSGQTLMVTSGGDLAYCDILTRNGVTSGDVIGTYTTSATSNNFLNIRGRYGYNTYDANTIKYSGVLMQLNNNEFRVNTDSVVLGAPYDPSHAGAFFRAVRNDLGTKTILIGESGGSAGTGGNYTSAYTSVGKAAFVISTSNANNAVILGTYNNSNKNTSAIASYNYNNLLDYNENGAKVSLLFPTRPGLVPEWAGTSYNDRKSYVGVRASQTNGEGLLTICSSATNKYGDTSQKCETVGFRVRAGWSAFDDKVAFNTNVYSKGVLYSRKLIAGTGEWPGGWGTKPVDGGVVYGYGETSARDTLTSYGKDPGRQYYTTDDNRVNVYNNTTSAWDKIAYLTDITGGGDGKVLATSSDTTPGYLIEKISAGANVEIINNGSYIEISAASGGGSGSSNWKVNGNTLSPLVDGNNVSISAHSAPSLYLYNDDAPVLVAQQNGQRIGVQIESSASAPALYVRNTGLGIHVETSATSPTIYASNIGSGSTLFIAGKSLNAPVIEINQAEGGSENGIMMYARPTSSKFAFEIWQNNGTSGGGCILAQGDSTRKPMVQIGNGQGDALRVTVGSTNLCDTYISKDSIYPAAIITNSSGGPALNVATGGIYFGSGITPPAGNFAGRPFWNTDSEELQIYDGTEWKDIGVEKYESVFPAQLGNYSFMQEGMFRIFERVIPKADTKFNTIGVFSLGSGIALQKFSLAVYEDSTSARICSIENENPSTTGSGIIGFGLDDTYYLKAGKSYWFSFWSNFNTSTPVLATSGAIENVGMAFQQGWSASAWVNPSTLPYHQNNVTSIRPFMFVEYV